MKLIDTLINLLFLVVILVVMYLLYKFLSNPVDAASKTVDSRFRAGKKDRLLFGFINLDEGFAGSKTILNKISGGRLFPTVEQQQRLTNENDPMRDDVGIRLPLRGETEFRYGIAPKAGNTFRTADFRDKNRNGVDDRDESMFRAQNFRPGIPKVYERTKKVAPGRRQIISDYRPYPMPKILTQEEFEARKKNPFGSNLPPGLIVRGYQ